MGRKPALWKPMRYWLVAASRSIRTSMPPEETCCLVSAGWRRRPPPSAAPLELCANPTEKRYLEWRLAQLDRT